MRWGLGLTPPAVALLVLAEAAKSLPLLFAGAFAAGAAAALSYRGSLQVLYGLAPADHRAEMGSAYYLAGFGGNALPVIGVGVITALASPLAGSAAFAVLIAVFALAALAVELRRPRDA
jgi:hypothetical protein